MAFARSAFALTRERRSGSQRGVLVAAALVGSWRAKPPPPTLTAAELEEISPLLLTAGCGALAWWRIRGSPVAESSIGKRLRDAYRLHTLQAAVHELELPQVVKALEAAGIEALTIKGWTAARLYAANGLRPYGDLDLCVAPSQHRAARAVVADSVPAVDVDLHQGLGINQRVVAELASFEEALARAPRLPLDGVEVSVLAPEDQLALLCVHFLRHGAWRPLWLCDIAAALERLPDGFDWDRCLGGSRRLETWVSSTVRLAEQLLGASPSQPLPLQDRVPRWLRQAVLRQWSSPRVYYPGDLIGLPAMTYFRPSIAARMMREHWVDPITATMFPGASFNSLPRLPFRLRFVAWKAARFARRYWRDIRSQVPTSRAPGRTSSPYRRG